MKPKNRLFSYVIPIDDGAAPNPFFGICTLAICKPVIRRVATVGDWIVGFGSKNAPTGDLSGKVVYAMEVTEKVSLEEYDKFATKRWPNKIPDFTHLSVERWLGDCIYDFSNQKKESPVLRQSVHTESNKATDLGGKHVLLSTNFYYFGKDAVLLPKKLKPIINQGQGHQSNKNQKFMIGFVKWINSQNQRMEIESGEQGLYVFDDEFSIKNSCEIRSRCAARDEKQFNSKSAC